MGIKNLYILNFFHYTCALKDLTIKVDFKLVGTRKQFNLTQLNLA